MNINQ